MKNINGIIYKTTNLVNNKWYIGQDQNNDPDYLGSGKVLCLAIAKYGKHSFKKEILRTADTNEELCLLEKQIIKETNAISDDNSYNITESNSDAINWMGVADDEQEPLQISKFLEEQSKIPNNTYKHNKELRSTSQKAFYLTEAGEKKKQLLSKQNKGKNLGEANHFYGKHHTKETKDKISKANKSNHTNTKKLNLDNRREIKELYSNGVPGTKIAKQYNISRTTLYRYLAE